MQPIIAVYFDEKNYDDYPFTKDEYKKSYHEFASLLLSKGGRLAIVRGQETYLGNNTFSHCWLFDGTTFTYKEGTITADLIYDKGHFKGDASAKLSNDPAFDQMCTDKSKTYELFRDDCPLTFVVRNELETKKAMADMRTELVVLKPLDGEEGHGVFVLPKDAAARKVPSYPYIVQEFIDTSGGIDGIVDGRHDFRIVSIGGEPVLAFVRTPPGDSFLANVSQGGKTVEVPIDAVPEEALKLFKRVDDAVERFARRIYSLDMGRDKSGKWYIIELNSKPALFSRDRGRAFLHFQEKLADFLLS
jgi:hypothetical protein